MYVAERQCGHSCHLLETVCNQALQHHCFEHQPLEFVERRRDHKRSAISSAAPLLGPPAPKNFVEISGDHQQALQHHCLDNRSWDLCKVRKCARTSMGTSRHMFSTGRNPKSCVRAMPCPKATLAQSTRTCSRLTWNSSSNSRC